MPAVGTLAQQYTISKREEYFAAARQALKNGADSLPEPNFAIRELLESGEDDGDPGGRGERDFATLRGLVLDADLGLRSPEFNRQLMQVAAAERQKWLEGDLPATGSSAGNRTWSSLGPQWERSAYNGTYYNAADSGRVTAIRLSPNPATPNKIYISTVGGGIWRANDITVAEPAWTPLTESLGILGTGSFDVAQDGRIYAGIGDPTDGPKAGYIVTSTDDGATWINPIQLTSTSAAPGAGGSTTVGAISIRTLLADPTNSSHLFVASDVGLFESKDGAQTFNLIDLPNTSAYGTVQEATWGLVYLGTDGTNTHWMVSGVYACPGQGAPAYQTATATACVAAGQQGNVGDVWVTHDSGATWASMRAAGGFPAAFATGTPAGVNEIGRIALAAAIVNPTDPSQTVVYGLASAVQELTAGTLVNRTQAVMSTTGGSTTWNLLGGGKLAYQITPINRTTGGDCSTLDIGHNQSGYDLTIGVDPAQPNNVIIGGNLCSARTRDGGATWELTSHWLPSGGGGTTNTGMLPYVHADWHTATLATVAGKTQVFIGCDGGFFTSRNVFDSVPGTQVDWRFPQYGLVTHLNYAMGSGDPTLGNHNLLWAGLQDNGTRYRLVGDENFVSGVQLQPYDQIIGGDGIGGAVATDKRGANAVYWASVQSSRRFCLPRSRDCQRPSRIENGVELGNWTSSSNPFGDTEPFLMRYGPLYDDNATVVSMSTQNVFRVNVNPATAAVFYTRLTPTNLGVIANATRSGRGAGAGVSPYLHQVDGVPARIYGIPMTSGAAGILIDKDAAAGKPFPTASTTCTTCQLIGGTSIVSVTVGGTVYTPLNTQAVMVPPDPTLIGGTDVRKTWVVGTASPTPMPAAVGQLFKTIDGGATWQPFHGNGTGADLPNVPVFAIKWDPIDVHTIWAGTELGVYRSQDDGNTWARYGQGMPMARVYDLFVSRNGSIVRAAVYGRGLWEIQPTADAAAAPGLGDYDKDGIIDFFDVAALAARLGQTPSSTPTAFDFMFPRYDSNLDLAGSPTTLEDADLTAQLAKVGGAP